MKWIAEESGYDDRAHVYPLDGRVHELVAECWCHPQADEDDPVILHNVEH